MNPAQQQFLQYATIANMQEFAFRILQGITGNDIAGKATAAELAQDVGAAINNQMLKEAKA